MGNLTAEEVVKITLGIIGIGFLIYLSVSLIGIFTYKTANEQAKATMDDLNEIATALKEGQTTEFLIEGPKEWGIINYDNEICICPLIKKYKSIPQEDQKKNCDKEGVCKTSDIYTIIGKDTACIYRDISILNCISLENAPRTLILKNSSGDIFLQTTESPTSTNLDEISGRYILDGKETEIDFAITYSEIGGKSFTFITLYPLFQPIESAKDDSPAFFIEKRNDEWIELNILYDYVPSVQTYKWFSSAGYISLKDGAIWASDLMLGKFMTSQEGKVSTTREEYKSALKTNVYLDIETLKEIKETLN
ncbi:hypothetical protein H8D36_06695 [archaeon]|nr:hypothetical protein [archaeon]